MSGVLASVYKGFSGIVSKLHIQGMIIVLSTKQIPDSKEEQNRENFNE